MHARHLVVRNEAGRPRNDATRAAHAQGGAMTEPRDRRPTRKTDKPAPAAQAAAETAPEPRWTRERRPLMPPIKVGREWDRVRRIAYL